MRRMIVCAVAALGILVAPRGISAWNTFSFTVVPFDFDPYRTHLVEAEWEDGIGCPTNSRLAPFIAPNFDTVGIGMFTDTACMTGDPRDKRNTGLLLVKTGPTNNDASAGATLNGVNGVSLTELGYDIRKPGSGTGLDVPGDNADPRGSHCGAGAPRFNIETYEDPGATYFLGCNSPPPVMDLSGVGWQRLRWGGTAPLLAYRNGVVLSDITNMTAKRLSIVFDEGQDPSGGPDQFGAAILDNIDVNGLMVGRGPDKPDEKDRDECEGEDKDHRHFHSHNSASRPETSNMSFEDPSDGTKIQMVNGASGISYSGACVTLVGDALKNEEPGYVVTFAACDLSALSTPLLPTMGSYSVLVTGASGVVYQKSGALTSGFVSIHPH
jgi:hypothetical protein